MRCRNGLFSGTYRLIYSNLWYFYKRIRFMRAYFWSPYLSNITRSTCTLLCRLKSLRHLKDKETKWKKIWLLKDIFKFCEYISEQTGNIFDITNFFKVFSNVNLCENFLCRNSKWYVSVGLNQLTFQHMPTDTHKHTGTHARTQTNTHQAKTNVIFVQA